MVEAHLREDTCSLTRLRGKWAAVPQCGHSVRSVVSGPQERRAAGSASMSGQDIAAAKTPDRDQHESGDGEDGNHHCGAGDPVPQAIMAAVLVERRELLEWLEPGHHRREAVDHVGEDGPQRRYPAAGPGPAGCR